MSRSLEPFAQLLGGDDSRIDLARGCLMIAQDAYPGLDVDRYLGEIERMAIRLRARMPQANAAEERVVALNQFLFDDLGYWGNIDDYYDPRNSYLNEVLDRRTGLPITLSVIFIEVARRAGVAAYGLSFPGHFLALACYPPDGVIVVDVLESVENARAAMTEMRKITTKPVKAVVYTHNHYDHVMGAEGVVDPADVGRIFQPFERLSDRTSHDGFGLGLAIVASIAAIHGGAATARPRDDGGLSVTVTMPSAGTPV